MSPLRSTRSFALATVGAAALIGACTTDDPGVRPGSSPLTCGAAPAHYLVDRVDVPVKSGDANRLGLDLDDDHTRDNALGLAATTLASAHPDDFDPSTAATAALTTGRVAWILSTTTCGGEVRVVVERATDVDGDGRYELDTGTEIPAGGTASAGHLVARDGRGRAPLATLTDPLGTFVAPGWTDADALGVDLMVTGDQLDGVVGFGLPMPEALPVLAGPLAAYFTAQLAAGTSDWAARIDVDHDGVITPAEFLDGTFSDNNPDSLVKLLLSPDLTLYGDAGRYGTSEARPPAALSAGVGVHAHVVATE